MHKKKVEDIISSLDPKHNKHLIESFKNNLSQEQQARKKSDTDDGISSDLVTEMIRKAMHAINDNYVSGGLSYIDKFYPDLGARIDTTQDELDLKAKACKEGKINIEEFRLVLKKYYFLNLKAIEIYKQR